MHNNRKIPVIKEQTKQSKTNRKLILLLFVFFFILLIVLFFQSSLAKITNIQIDGVQITPSVDIEEKIPFYEGDSYFFLDEAQVIYELKQLRTVEGVSIKKKFPGKIMITLEESKPVAYQYNALGELQMILSNGQAFDPSELDRMLNVPILSGWNVENLSEDFTEQTLDTYSKFTPILHLPVVQQWELNKRKSELCNVLNEIPEYHLNDISEIVPLHGSSIYPDKIKLYTRSNFEVITTTQFLQDGIDTLFDKVSYLINEKNILTGQIILLEAQTHRPFTSENEEAG
ncbi:cell division protein FtsQ/DivIB [Longirhabdus pacifica]|uniref:cell division protein FtsQ/DivIB n=1 Tax=Longirhabdus pacifica TaxID=2305227 RepID=UPI0013E89EBA|nr:FtsQ-type POTRA domain-containing protein [Longirhabdus pacifica]